jgi:hypothetical protein
MHGEVKDTVLESWGVCLDVLFKGGVCEPTVTLGIVAVECEATGDFECGAIRLGNLERGEMEGVLETTYTRCAAVRFS